MINYIVQVLLFQTVFLAVYDLILKKETFFQWNRSYLIFSSVLAYIIPLVKFESVSRNIPQEYIVMLPEVMLSPSTYIEKQVDFSIILFTVFQWIFLTGMVIATLLFIYKLIQIIKLISKNDSQKTKDYDLVILEKDNSAFSFFRYIFLGKTVQQKDEIIKHELIHVKQKHSLDLLFFELQKIIFWFNPFSYLYQNRIAEVHEFIADSKTINQKDKTIYFQKMLAETFQVDKITFVNAFYKPSIIKKRIMMLAKNNSKEILKFKYLLMIPVLMGMLIYTSCENTETDKALSKINEKRLTKIVMAGYTTKEGKVVPEKVFQGEREGYFDFYFNKTPPGKVIRESNLSDEEKIEFKKFSENFQKPILYEYENGNRGVYLNFKTFFTKKEKLIDYSNASEVPFTQIDQVPVYPGCENAEDQKACMIQKITKYVGANFDTSITKELDLKKGKKRVYVQFKIDKTGAIVDIKARGPHKDLEVEALRVVSSLPPMQPGKQNGKAVGVKYTLPITLVVE
jgi:bla regulator protein blaR1